MLQNPTHSANGRQESFFAELLGTLNETSIPYRVGGTCAVNVYVDLERDTKDLDIFCRPGDYPRLLGACADAGYRTEVEDERWIAKVRRGRAYCDVIFGSANAVTVITDSWLREERPATVLGVPVLLLPPTEMVFSKCFIKDRMKYDGNDIAHLILCEHETIDWRRLLGYMDQHWEVLLAHLLTFRYIYPTERRLVPDWLLDELLGRLAAQRAAPIPQKRICRGRIFSRSDFIVDVRSWGFADVVGDDGEWF